MASIASLKALIVVLVALAIAYVIRPRFKDEGLAIRILLFWGWAAISALAFQIPFVRILLLFIGMLIFAPQKFEDRAPFLLCCLFAVPVEASWVVPFPGINFLIKLGFVSLIFMVLGTPILLGAGRDRRAPSTNPNTALTDTAVIMLVIATWLLDMRAAEATMTTGMRSIVMKTLTITLPYYAISRGMGSPESMRAMVRGIVAISPHLVVLGLITFLMQWNVYMEVDPSGVLATTNSRGSSIRVVLTTAHAMAGLLITMAAMALWFARDRLITPKIVVYGLLPGTLFVLLATQSRGALLAAMVAFAVLVFCRVRSMGLRTMMVIAGTIFSAIAIPFIVGGDVSEIDEFGTFSYRQDLLVEGMRHIVAHPIFGQADFMSDPRFDYLLQGQGIVDFTNGYLIYGLQWGLVGLGLLLFLHTRTVLSLIRSADRFHAKGHDDLAGIAMGVAAAQVGYMAMIATISFISFIGVFGFVLVGLGSAVSGLSKRIPATDALTQSIEGNHTSQQPSTRPSPPPEGQTADGEFNIDITPGVKGWPT